MFRRQGRPRVDRFNEPSGYASRALPRWPHQNALSIVSPPGRFPDPFEPRILGAAGIAPHGFVQIRCRQAVPPGRKLRLFGLLAGGNNGPGLRLRVQGGLLIGGNIALGPAVIAVLGQGPKGPGTGIGHGLTIFVAQLVIGQLVLEVVQALDQTVGGFPQGDEVVQNLANLFGPETASSQIGPGRSDDGKR